jgi:hypothetical protein
MRPDDSASSSPSRRDLLRLGLAGAAAGSLWAALGPAGRALAEETRTGGRDPSGSPLPGRGLAKQVVFLYMGGGASQFETVDPKPGTSTGGPTRTVPTTIPGVHFADSLPLLARQTGDLCLVRSMTSKEGSHERARYLMHTGHPPNPTVDHASWGAIVSHQRGDPAAEIPPYVSIGGPGHGPGYLGVLHAAFVVQDAERPLQNVAPPAGVSARRRDARLDLLSRLNERFSRDRGAAMPEAQAAMFERARRLMDSPHLEAFDLGKERDATRDRYGRTSFGRNALLARRLVERGVPFVEVVSNGWDTHEDNFSRVKALNADLDRGATALLSDLKSAGLLGSTLVLWLGDFGRTPRITAGDGRGHYPQAWSVWLAGGGVQGGRVVGATDERGERVADRPVTVADLFASVAHATGIDPAHTTHLPNGRPITFVEPTGIPAREFFEA